MRYGTPSRKDIALLQTAPIERVARVTEINAPALARQGYVNWGIDVDHTIAYPLGGMPSEIRDYLAGHLQSGVIQQLCLISDAGWHGGMPRLWDMAEELGCSGSCVGGIAYFLNMKPSRSIMLAGVRKMKGATPQDTVIIGDRILKDVLGARRIGARAILIDDPIGLGEEPHWLAKVYSRDRENDQRVCEDYKLSFTDVQY